MINRFFTTTFSITRQSWTGDSSNAVTQGNFRGHIQQSTDENLSQSVGLRFTKAFEIWCPANTNVKEGDRLTEGNNSYDVKLKIDRNIGVNTHLHLLVEKLDE